MTHVQVPVELLRALTAGARHAASEFYDDFRLLRKAGDDENAEISSLAAEHYEKAADAAMEIINAL